MRGIIAACDIDLRVIHRHRMAVTGLREALGRDNGVDGPIHVELHRIHVGGGDINGVVGSTTNKIDIVQGTHRPHARAGLGKDRCSFGPIADGAVIVELSDIDLVFPIAPAINAAHGDEVGLGGRYGHIPQAQRQCVEGGPSGETVVLLLGTIDGVHAGAAVVAAHDIDVVAPLHHLVTLQGLRHIGSGCPLPCRSKLLLKGDAVVGDDDILTSALHEVAGGRLGKVHLSVRHAHAKQHHPWQNV